MQDTIRATAGVFGLLLLGACATLDPEEDVDAFGDFVAVNALPEADSFRTFSRVDQEVLSDHYVIVDNGRELFLLEYMYRCVEDPTTGRPRADVRRDATRIYAARDTFRGCRIKALYPVTQEQAQELRELGEAPGRRN